MTSPFSFKGEIGRATYLWTSVAAFSLQYVFVFAVIWFGGRGPDLHALFWLLPMRVLIAGISHLPQWIELLGLLVLLLVNWAMLALAYRRMRVVGFELGFILLVAVPVLQLLMVPCLAFLPRLERETPQEDTRGDGGLRGVALGLLTGVALCLAAVAFSALVLGIYGYGLFVLAPIVVGMTVAIFANHDADLGARKTTGLVMTALSMGGLALLFFAFEGAICILMASPLIALMGFIGGAIGRAIAEGRRGRRTAIKSIALLPILLAAEALFPPQADFESVESIVVMASPQAVWHSIVNMEPIPGAPAAPFRWGLAYPMRGEINGEGVGAVRRGVFSTGVAYERVTTWEPEHRLFFTVLSDPPSMRELSPYEHVSAPHTQSYFRTRDARFTITPLEDGRTRLTLATHHDLDLEPALYWLPFSHWAVHANKVRVLRHFKQQAEEQVVDGVGAR